MASRGLYIITGRCLEGVRVKGYVVKHIETGECKVISKADTEYLAQSKQIINCTGQVYEGKVVLKGTKCKLVDLPNYDLQGKLIQKDKSADNKNVPLLSIKARIVDGKNTIGYVIYGLTMSGESMEKKIERDKVLVLAREGKISNARVQMFNNKPLLRGVKCELAQLPVVRV